MAPIERRAHETMRLDIRGLKMATSMTRQHFIAIAAILRKNDVAFETITDFCLYFCKVNPSFDILKFQEAAGFDRSLK